MACNEGKGSQKGLSANNTAHHVITLQQDNVNDKHQFIFLVL